MSNTQHLLIIEDDEGLMSQMRWSFDEYNILTANNRKEAWALVRQFKPQVVLQDLGLPPDPEGISEGMTCIGDILAISPTTKIIVLTGKNDPDAGVEAIGQGAYDFYSKPVDIDILQFLVSRAFKIHHLEEKYKLSTEQKSYAIDGMISSDPAMQKVVKIIGKIAQTSVTCTILGESGTGKEVLARVIHSKSDRSDKPFVAINCAAVPESLIESELFGHEKGAFTGATTKSEGKFERADTGTLFLDEIGDMPLNLQAKLLRFLQERVIERVGGKGEIAVDVRVLCATNKDLKTMVDQGEFREDLYYRIAEMVLNLPPLRDREADKILLARYFLRKYVMENNLNIVGFTESAVKAIQQYSWPGNIRELENRIKRAVIMADGNMVTCEDVGLDSDDSLNLLLKDVRMNAEKKAITEAVNITDGNISAASKLLGITRPTFYDLIKKYSISL